LLQDARIDPQTIRGYETEEFTHLAVAAMIAGNAADVGLGIHAAAAQFGLNFKPMFVERYLLAVRHDLLHTPPVAQLVDVLASSAFRAQTAAIEGYDSTGAGTVYEVDTVLSGLAVRH
jgi:molybdate-binding protein